MKLKELISDNVYKGQLEELPLESKCIINTINAYSYCEAKNDDAFLNALLQSSVLIPDGIAIVMAARSLNKINIQKIAGADIHQYLLEKANAKSEKVFYLGASESTLRLIEKRITREFPNIKVASFSPPYKMLFSMEETNEMLTKIENFNPSVLFVGMTAPKQEKWVYTNKDKIDVNVIVSIGAVFDFYAGTVKRAPQWMIGTGMEWLFRLVKEPKRMWRRYLIGNTKFCWFILIEKFKFFSIKRY